MNNSINYISSSSNETVKMIRSLHSLKGRKEKGLFIIQGSRSCQTILASAYIKPYALFATNKEAELADLWSEQYNMPWHLVTDSVMEKISTTHSPSGILLVAETPPQKEYQNECPGLILGNITDPGNTGTLIRSAVACGVTTIIMIEGVDAWNPKVIQATAGLIGEATLYELSWEELLEKTTSEKIYALVPDQTKIDIATIDLKNKLLLIGNEAHGINPLWLNQCKNQVTIPMQKSVESLNAAVAGSIALYLSTK